MKKIKGVYTATVTPFDSEGKVDEATLRELIHKQLEAGVDGITLVGSTGEAPTLSEQEKKRMIVIAREEIPEHCVLMVGTGSYNTAHVIEETKIACDLGADVALIVTPYYNRPSQEGLYRHFKAICEEVSLPFMIYNIPGRTGVNLERATLEKLLEFPTIVGIKETAASIFQQSEFIETIRRERPEFSVMSGNDSETLSMMALGGDGVISVLSNLMPTEVISLVNACAHNDFSAARELHYQLAELIRALFIDTNPIPIKAALGLIGSIVNKCRLPLYELSLEHTRILSEAMKKFMCVNCR